MHLRTVDRSELDSLCLSLEKDEDEEEAGSEGREPRDSLCLSDSFLMGLIFSSGRLCQWDFSRRCMCKLIVTSEGRRGEEREMGKEKGGGEKGEIERKGCRRRVKWLLSFLN